MNWYVLFIAALIPLFTGFVWYNDKVLGSSWKKATGFDPERAAGANMALIFTLTYILGVLLSLALVPVVVHQMHIYSLFAETPNAQEAGSEMMNILTAHGDKFRTFKHGAFHGVLNGIIFVLPIIGIIALFERRGGRYIFIHAGYWTLTLALMGGLICAMV